MADGIYNDEMFSASGIVPWHRKGTVVQEAPDSRHAMILAKQDWDVVLKRVCLEDGTADPNHLATCRSDKDGWRQILGIVGKDYVPVQNVEAFEFMDALVGTGDVRYETAGCLFGGKRVWMMVKVPAAEMRIAGVDDLTEMFLLLSNSHDGTAMLRATVTPVRAVCNNTVKAGLKAARADWKMVHTGDVQARLLEARDALGMTFKWAEEFSEAANWLAGQEFSLEQMTHLSKLLYPKREGAKSEPKVQERVVATFAGEETCNLKGIEGTRWAAYNAVTLAADWGRRPLRPDAPQERVDADTNLHLNSIWFGDAARVKSQAWSYLTAKELPPLPKEREPVLAGPSAN